MKVVTMSIRMRKVVGRIVGGLERLKGKKNLRVLEVNTHPNEVYHFHTSNNGRISIHCVETLYEITYQAWWARRKPILTYKVYGICDERIPSELKERLDHGLQIGSILPPFALRKDQKKAAIHAYVSLIVNEFKELG